MHIATPHSRKAPIAILLWTLLLSATALPQAQAEEETKPQDPELKQALFQKSYPVLSETLILLDRHEGLPDSAWVHTDKKDNQEKINALLTEAIGILQVSDGVNLRLEAENFRTKIAELRAQNAAFRRDRVTAPSEPLAGIHTMPFRTTTAGYDDKIRTNQEIIGACETAIVELRANLVQKLAARGIKISDEHATSLLATVDGRDYLALSAVFENVKWLTQKFQELSIESEEDLETAKQYYGLYLVLLHIVNDAQKQFVERINSEYLPKLTDFEANAKQIIESSQAALRNRQLTDDNRAAEEDNVKSARITLAVIEQYRHNLKRQAARIAKRNKRIAQDLTTATNTYRTVSLSQQLVTMMRDNVTSFQALMTMEPPPIIPFQNKAMATEYSNLSILMSDL